jgi:hypothetical protein
VSLSAAELVALMRKRQAGVGLSDYQRRVLAHIREQACVDEICPRCERAAIIEVDAKVERATAEELAAGEAERWWGPWKRFHEAYVKSGVHHGDALRMLERNKDK